MKEENTHGDSGIVASVEKDKVLQQCVESIVKKEELKSVEIVIAPITIKGAGYLGIPYTIDIKGKTENGDLKEINMFVKKPLTNISLDAIFSQHAAYSNEGFVYKELSKVFKNLQDDADVPVKDRYKIIKCFDETSAEAIVLENITRAGFKCHNRMEIAKEKFLELGLEQLAKFHALGFVMQKKMPEYYNNKIRHIKYPYKFNESWKTLTKPLLKISRKHLSSEVRKKAENFLPILLPRYEQHLCDTNSISTMCHGDFRANNLMYKEIDDEITEIIVFDFQTIHHGCPINDMLHLIYGCTDQQFRNLHKDRLINLYYQSLSEFLNYFAIDVTEIYPKKEFDKALDERADYGLMLALYFYPTYFAANDDVPDVSGDLTKIDFNLDVKIVRRLEEIIEEYYEGKNKVL